MGVITILCPRTGQQVSTGIEVDFKTYQAMPMKHAVMRCWACGGEHSWNKRWATFSAEAVEERESAH